MRKSGLRKRFKPILSTLFFMGILFLYLWFRLEAIHLGYKISSATKEEERLTQLNSQLKIELGSLKSPSRIGKIAQQQLGLSYPSKDQVIILK